MLLLIFDEYKIISSRYFKNVISPSTAELLSETSTICGGPSLFPIGLSGTEGLLIKSSKS